MRNSFMYSLFTLITGVALFVLGVIDFIGLGAKGEGVNVATIARVKCGLAIVFVLFATKLLKKPFKPKRKPKPITAILYDSKVENAYDMVVIPYPMQVIYTRDFSDMSCKTYFVSNDKNVPPIKKMKFEFFCIRDDGKHVFIERP